jgi:hypothetical protein
MILMTLPSKTCPGSMSEVICSMRLRAARVEDDDEDDEDDDE